MVRYNRMNGRPTLWLPGTDHAVGRGKDASVRRH
jgi:valyl-tRNA synthetase